MNFYSDSKQYQYDISVPDNAGSEEENQIVLDTFNRIRRILGLEEQTEI